MWCAGKALFPLMFLRWVWLANFRSYESFELALGPGFTAILGDNGQGKTNLVEAIAFVALLESFRGAPPEALVRDGASSAIVRAEIMHGDGREVLLEAEIPVIGRTRVFVNRQRLARARDLLGALRVTLFAPDDLGLVKGGPSGRRRFLDDVLVSLNPPHDRLRRELDRILRQRTALLRQAGGRVSGDTELTLDVWDTKLSETGETLGRLRACLVSELEPLVAKAYEDVAGSPAAVSLGYDPAWRREGLAASLLSARAEDLRQAVTTVGPHRDELELRLAGSPARTHASQGEQRLLALALRLAAHTLVTDRIADPPVLLLDDVLSELDAERASALLHHLPAGQVIVTTAGALPPVAHPDAVVTIGARQ